VAAVVDNRIVLTTPTFGIERLAYTVSDGRGGTASANAVFLIGARESATPPVRAVANADLFRVDARGSARLDVLDNDAGSGTRDTVTLRVVEAPQHGQIYVRRGYVYYAPWQHVRDGDDRFVYEWVNRQGVSSRAPVHIFIENK
jgi:hypothetical protein